MYINELERGPELLTLDEAKRFLRIGRTTAYQLARTGRLPCIKVGGSYRITRDALAQYLTSGQLKRN